MSKTLETMVQLKARFNAAFRRFSTHDTALRVLQSGVPKQSDAAWIHGIDAQQQKRSSAHRAYKAVRLEYVERLLDQKLKRD